MVAVPLLEVGRTGAEASPVVVGEAVDEADLLVDAAVLDLDEVVVVVVVVVISLEEVDEVDGTTVVVVAAILVPARDVRCLFFSITCLPPATQASG